MSKRYVGFDIGNDTLKMVYVSGRRVKRTVFAHIPEELVASGVVTDMDAMADFISNTAKENSIPLMAGASVILPSSLVYVRNLNLPLMTDQQLKYNLPFEFKDYLGEESARYIFDYSVLGTGKDPQTGNDCLRVVACATLKSTVESYRAMFKRAGFVLKTALPTEEAVAAVMRASSKNGSSDKYCVVDIGYSAVKVRMFSGSEHLVSNHLELGIKDIDAVIMDIYGVDRNQAHHYLLDNYNNVMNDERCAAILRRISIEIMRSIHFFNYNNRGSTLKEVYICGSGYRIPALLEVVSSVINEEGAGGDSGRQLKQISELMPPEVEEPWLFLSAYGCTLVK